MLKVQSLPDNTKIHIPLFEQSPKPKGCCPKCGAKGSFRYYEGLPREYGRCERINHCSYHNKPETDFLRNLIKEGRRLIVG